MCWRKKVVKCWLLSFFEDLYKLSNAVVQCMITCFNKLWHLLRIFQENYKNICLCTVQCILFTVKNIPLSLSLRKLNILWTQTRYYVYLLIMLAINEHLLFPTNQYVRGKKRILTYTTSCCIFLDIIQRKANNFNNRQTHKPVAPNINKEEIS